MAVDVNVTKLLAGGALPALLPDTWSPPQRLLLIADDGLARAFQTELRRCSQCAVSLEIYASFEEAQQAGDGAYHWVVIDLNGAIAPTEAVGLARCTWPAARVAVLSLCWSERDALAQDLADTVIHKPLRSAELLAFLLAAGAPERPAFPAEAAS